MSIGPNPYVRPVFLTPGFVLHENNRFDSLVRRVKPAAFGLYIPLISRIASRGEDFDSRAANIWVRRLGCSRYAGWNAASKAFKVGPSKGTSNFCRTNR